MRCQTDRLSLRLASADLEALRALQLVEDRSVSALVREAIAMLLHEPRWPGAPETARPRWRSVTGQPEPPARALTSKHISR